MKNLFLVLVILLTFFTAKASHIFGGTIYWECHPNGQFQFFMEVYRDCTGIPFEFKDETLEILGSPLPSNGVTSIALKPDSSRWLNSGKGDLSPKCTSLAGREISCASENPGAVQIFYYESDLIRLEGVPHAAGWLFSWESLCCRPSDIENVDTKNGTNLMLLRALMYPSASSQNTISCFDTSPKFVVPPNSTYCKGTKNYIDLGMATDIDADSIVYRFDRTYSPPANNPIPLSFKPRFDQSNPTPDEYFNPSNEASYLDPETGLYSFAVYSGNSIQKFLIVVRADAYRNGVRLASIFREIPVSLFNCRPLLSGKVNDPPRLYFDGIEANTYELNVAAGQRVSVPIQVLDSNFTLIDSALQGLTLKTNGLLYTQDYNSGSPCQVSGNTPCAFLQNTNPSLDSNLAPVDYSIKGLGEINTQFVWQTDCSHLDADGSSKIYYFNFTVQDDHCPIPEKSAAVIKVTVYPSIQNVKPSIDCIQRVGNNHRISWNTSTTQMKDFSSLELFSSNNPNGPFTQIAQTADSTVSYLDASLSGGSSPYYYIQIKALDCNQNSTTSPTSDTVQISSGALSVSNLASCFELTWDYHVRSTNSSGQKFVIYREYPQGSGFQKIDSVFNRASYCDALVSCSDSVFYYVTNETCAFQTQIGKSRGSTTIINKGLSLVNGTFTANSPTGKYQWYNCNSKMQLEGQIFRTFSPRDTGSYAVIVTQFGCRDTSECIPIYAVGLEENTFQKNISFQPNPTKGLLNIQLNRTYQNLHLQIRNLQGQLVQENQFSNAQKLTLDIQARAGVYFVELTNEKGERANLKVIKQ